MNHKFLSEIISYVVSKGITLPEIMDAYYERIYAEKSEVTEVTKGDFNLLLCGRSVEENSTPCQNTEKEPERDLKPVKSSWIDYPKNIKNHGNGVSPARKALFDVVGDKTVIEHLRANGIDYKVYDNRVRKKWSIADACTTPLAPRGKGKRKRVIEEPEESMAVIVPDNVKVVEESSTPEPKTKMMLVNGKMTEMKVSDTDLVQSSIEKPAETLETQTETLETQSNTEKATESVTIEPQIKTDTDTKVNNTNANSDAIHRDKDNIEKALKKFITSTTGIEYEESKKDKKPKEAKKDYTVSDVCFKLNLTTHELREMVNTGEFPQPDCGNKWSVKLLKDKNII